MHQLTSFVIVVNGNEKNNRKLFISVHWSWYEKQVVWKWNCTFHNLPLYNCPKTTRTAGYRAVQCVHLLSYFTMCEV